MPLTNLILAVLLTYQRLLEINSESNIPIAYVGDTIADVNTVINARKNTISEIHKYRNTPPHLQLNSRLKERNSYETNLKMQALT